MSNKYRGLKAKVRRYQRHCEAKEEHYRGEYSRFGNFISNATVIPFEINQHYRVEYSRFGLENFISNATVIPFEPNQIRD